jgi:tight adherence protein B
VTGVAIALAALAAALAVPGPGSAPDGPWRRARFWRGRAPAVPLLGALGVGALAVRGGDGTGLLLGVILVAAACAGARLVTRGRARAAAGERQGRVVEVCEVLAGELRAGQPPVRGLQRCCEAWPEFEPVAAAGRLGADVPEALRRLAATPGAAGLDDVAAAWRTAEGSGAGMAAALGQVAATAREAQAARQLVQAELASAQATAWLVAALPVVSLGMASGFGADPWHFLLGTPFGLACLSAGLGLGYAGMAWIDRIAAGALGR